VFQDFQKIPMSSVMKLPLFPYLIGLLIFQPASAQYGVVRTNPDHVETSWVTYVTSSKAYVWSKPGWTNRDCEDLSKSDQGDTRNSKYGQERHEQAAEICHNRLPEHLLQETQVIKVLTKEVHNPNGQVTTEPIHEEHNVSRFGRTERLRFYKVRLESNPESHFKEVYEGWVAADQVTTPEPKELPSIPQATECVECSTVGKTVTNGLPEMSKEIEARSNYLEIPRHTGELEMKSEAGLAMFTCLHRGNIRIKGPPDTPKETDEFFEKFPEFIESANLAEKAFGMPKELVRCSMLAESGLRKNSRNDRGAAGYSQIMPDTMAHLQELVKKTPYMEMWNEYKASVSKSPVLTEKRTEMTNLIVCVQNNIPSSTAAMALYYRWLYDNYVTPAAKTSACKNCSIDPHDLKRKDIDLMLIGYNAGPAFPALFASKVPADILADSRLPAETRKHINEIENCMRKGWDTSFTESDAKLDIINKGRQKKIQILKNQTGAATSEDTQEKIQFYQNMITIRANYSYEDRVKDCNERSKKNWQSTPSTIRRQASDSPSQK
jgi:hypothetical protein